MIVVYVGVKIFTGLNKIEDQGQSQTLTVSTHYLSYHFKSAISQLRAGGSKITEAAWLLITIWMLQQ